jgi:hypothetical protein
MIFDSLEPGIFKLRDDKKERKQFSNGGTILRCYGEDWMLFYRNSAKNHKSLLTSYSDRPEIRLVVDDLRLLVPGIVKISDDKKTVKTMLLLTTSSVLANQVPTKAYSAYVGFMLLAYTRLLSTALRPHEMMLLLHPTAGAPVIFEDAIGCLQ